MTSPPPPAATCTADEPFDDVNADIVLRSSDDVDFKVFKCILSLASPVFKDTVTLAAPTLDQSPDLQSLPIVYMSENSDTLDVLLRLIYPGATQASLACGTFEVLLLLAIEKYDMIPPITDRAKELVMDQFLEKRAVSIYAIACEHKWKDLAQRAARETLKIRDLGRPEGYAEELENLKAGAFYRLLAYHHACGVAAAQVNVTPYESHRDWPDPSTIKLTTYDKWLCAHDGRPAKTEVKTLCLKTPSFLEALSD
ncbi:hypothetical protein ID866_12141, partial [Astraeus odoratus]